MKVLYFAWVKVKTGVGEEDVTPPPEVTNVGELIEWLKTRSPAFAEAFADPELVHCAVNQDYARNEHPIAPGDEVAFFPPITGG